jgi:hypothetical protein
MRLETSTVGLHELGKPEHSFHNPHAPGICLPTLQPSLCNIQHPLWSYHALQPWRSSEPFRLSGSQRSAPRNEALAKFGDITLFLPSPTALRQVSRRTLFNTSSSFNTHRFGHCHTIIFFSPAFRGIL